MKNDVKMWTQNFNFESTTNVENRIVNVEDLPESHKAGRRIGNVMTNEMMMMHYCGLKAPHEIREKRNFVHDG